MALYDPVKEFEHYLDGQHNGGYFNPRNTSVYGYCYQNPVRYVDPNGKQVTFMVNKDGSETWNVHLKVLNSTTSNSRLGRYSKDQVLNVARSVKNATEKFLSGKTKEGTQINVRVTFKLVDKIKKEDYYLDIVDYVEVNGNKDPAQGKVDEIGDFKINRIQLSTSSPLARASCS